MESLQVQLVSSKDKEQDLAGQIEETTRNQSMIDVDQESLFDQEMNHMNQLGFQFSEIIQENNQYLSIIDRAIKDAEFWRNKYIEKE